MCCFCLPLLYFFSFSSNTDIFYHHVTANSCTLLVTGRIKIITGAVWNNSLLLRNMPLKKLSTFTRFRAFWSGKTESTAKKKKKKSASRCENRVHKWPKCFSVTLSSPFQSHYFVWHGNHRRVVSSALTSSQIVQALSSESNLDNNSH